MEFRWINGFGRLHHRKVETRLVIDCQPVVFCHSLITLHLVTREEPQGWPCQRLSLTGFRQLHEIAVSRGCRPWFIVVPYEITFMGTALARLILATIATVLLSPVVIDIVLVFHKDITVLTVVGGTVQTGAAVIVMCQQIMMERSRRAAPLAGIAAIALLMTGIVESLMDDTPLNGREMVIVDGHIFLSTPSETAMVDNDGIRILDTDRSTLDKVLVATQSDTSTKISHDNITRAAQVQFPATIQDAVPRSGLSSYSNIVQLGTDILFKRDDATDAEHNSSILTTGFCQGPAQGPLTTVIEIGHLYHFASPPTRSILSKAFC